MRASPVLGPPTDGSAGSLSADLPDGARILPRLGDTDGSSVARGGSAPEVGAFLDDAVEALAGLRGAAAAEALLFGFVEAADFAGRVEDLARTLEYVQIIAAQAVERTRNEARLQVQGSGAPEWRTGWTEPAANGGATGAGAGTGADSAGASAGSVLDDGYRNPAEFLRARLRIGIGEARRRLSLAADALPGEGTTGQQVPARREHLAQALATAQIPSRSATIIATALEKIQHLTDQDTITRMEHALTRTATQSDPDFVTTMTRRWTDRIDQDGPEPSEEALRHTQGAFLRRRRRYGLHHLEIFATAEQYETLTTAMNTATNPRLTTTTANTTKPDTNTSTSTSTGTADPDTAPEANHGPVLDRRSRAQKLLDGLVGACAVAMTTGKLPTNGGLRPQLTVTIDHRDLLNTITRYNHTNPGISTGTATFTGRLHPNTIRKIACDADIIPVLLGTDSQILDIGRATRLFPPHIRKAITARDQGCAFPDCTLPAPWCEAHHITYWSHGGTTGTENGTLLCSHHHHLIHKEQWHIDMKTGTPRFIPPPHIDPHQTPRRNHHHTVFTGQSPPLRT
ncbi:HNH endonuclease signature motif containing protein [Paenarthrobacter sp. JL.01a]|uniref:HNH endonuclease signature motif containing protein n=1 Tax=Paenarthrobacter sp. JL.01a TaxID=2979324 RepID=UPI0021C93CEE|nr:HNH endonuclease signature motif containing protein [Paenarthrobacter sp. JL.01a]UXM92760.1 HNH endonuclease [Paenarthrobacter sp. JL.01a]